MVPQSAERPSHGRAGLGLASLFGRPAAKEVLVGQMEQVEAAQELYPCDLDEIDREQRCDRAEEERTDQTVSEGVLLLRPGQAEDHDGDDQRIVGAEKPLEDDEEPTVMKSLSWMSMRRAGGDLDTPHIKSYIGSAGLIWKKQISTLSAWLRACSDMHPQTLRKYERLGLVRPTRTIGSMRVYSRDELERLRADQAPGRRRRHQPGGRAAAALDCAKRSSGFAR